MSKRSPLTTPDWQAAVHLPAEDWLAAQGKYDKLKPPSAEVVAEFAQPTSPDRERLMQIAPGVWARVSKYPESGGTQTDTRISLVQQNNGPMCTPDNP